MAGAAEATTPVCAVEQLHAEATTPVCAVDQLHAEATTFFHTSTPRTWRAGEPICVVNTHLFYHPYAPHIRTMHTAAILEEAVALLGRLGCSPSPAMLFVGDLNSDLNDGIPGDPDEPRMVTGSAVDTSVNTDGCWCGHWRALVWAPVWALIGVGVGSGVDAAGRCGHWCGSLVWALVWILTRALEGIDVGTGVGTDVPPPAYLQRPVLRRAMAACGLHDP
eukprot:361860-Chlamydomonas_euryale.AAC.4